VNVIAGRRAHRPPTPDKARADLVAAQGELERAYDVVNAAIHARGRACANARDAGLGWEEIGDFLGGIRRNSAQELAGRWRAAVKAGQTLGLKHGRMP
jgi:hypothetical protein